MKKIRLDLDRLSVDSFPTTNEGATARGTVRGHIPPAPISHPPTVTEPCSPQTPYCGTYDTCDMSCGGTCFEVSCVPSCAITCPDPIGLG